MSQDYLIIEPFVADALQARMLQAAFDMGIIETLEHTEQFSPADLLKGRDCDTAGGLFLVQVLIRSGVLNSERSQLQLTKQFRDALKYRDLLTTKLSFSALVADDYFSNMPQLLRSAEDFMSSSRLFELFDYGNCLDVTPGNCLQASRWMQLTTMLTRYEAPVCHSHYDFHQHQRLLDVGGNSGEFALQICRREPQLRATVVDLPVVCAVGARHLQGEPEADRIQFLPANMLDDPFPAGHDLITWKSVLHDWPDQHMQHLIQKTWQALPTAGRILIFERQKWDFSVEAMPYGLLPVILFFRSYRTADQYCEVLHSAGFTDVAVQQIQLEVPFMLITARKP